MLILLCHVFRVASVNRSARSARSARSHSCVSPAGDVDLTGGHCPTAAGRVTAIRVHSEPTRPPSSPCLSACSSSSSLCSSPTLSLSVSLLPLPLYSSQTLSVSSPIPFCRMPEALRSRFSISRLSPSLYLFLYIHLHLHPLHLSRSIAVAFFSAFPVFFLLHHKHGSF